jgi:hypothetical protein
MRMFAWIRWRNIFEVSSIWRSSAKNWVQKLRSSSPFSTTLANLTVKYLKIREFLSQTRKYASRHIERRFCVPSRWQKRSMLVVLIKSIWREWLPYRFLLDGRDFSNFDRDVQIQVRPNKFCPIPSADNFYRESRLNL